MIDQSYYLGLEIGDALIKSALTNDRGEILEIEQQDTPREASEALAEAILAAIHGLRRKAEERRARVVALGVGVPAVINPETRRVEFLGDFASLGELDLNSLLASAIPLPVVIDSVANAAAYGEFISGAAKGVQNVMFVSLGPDISAGLIQGGVLYRGSLGYAGGFGHMTVHPDGLECACGNVGCLETIASGTNLVRRTKERLFHDRSSSLSSLALPEKGELTPQRIAMEALDGDDFALMMLERTGAWIGLAIANVVNLLNLDMVILAGGVMVAGDLLLHPIVKEVKKRALAVPRDHCRIVLSDLGGQAGLIGAAMLARDTVQE